MLAVISKAAARRESQPPKHSDPAAAREAGNQERRTDL